MELVLFLVQVPGTLMVLYLLTLSVTALLWRRAPPVTSLQHHFALLIPAHNEETLLPRLLASIATLDYPRHLYDIHVVADNCTDQTSAVATAAGVTVHERHDERQRGKGYALRWLLGHVHDSGSHYDGYVIFDADSVVSTTFLTIMNRHLARGDLAVQSYYGVMNHEESWSSGLRYAALALFNNLRPRGRDALGLSAGLRGNGMCFSAAVIDRFGWDAFTLAEDAEFHLSLVEAGIKVRYAPDATVLAEMPSSLRGAHTQNVRWERGRLQMLRTFGPRLLLHGLLRGNAVKLDAVAEQLVPPLSVLTGVTALTFLLMGLLRAPGPFLLACLVLLGQLGYVAAGLWLVRAGPRVYLTFLAAPLYIGWKIWIYALAGARLQDSRWIRTARSPRDL